MKTYTLIPVLFVIFLTMLLVAYYRSKESEPRTIDKCEVCGVTITKDDKGRCWFNNGLELYQHPVKCEDRKKILRKVCK